MLRWFSVTFEKKFQRRKTSCEHYLMKSTISWSHVLISWNENLKLNRIKRQWRKFHHPDVKAIYWNGVEIRYLERVWVKTLTSKFWNSSDGSQDTIIICVHSPNLSVLLQVMMRIHCLNILINRLLLPMKVDERGQSHQYFDLNDLQWSSLFTS